MSKAADALQVEADDLQALEQIEQPTSNEEDAMPLEAWKSLRLGDVATFKNGLNFSPAEEGHEIKIVGVSDFKRHTELLNTESLKTIKVLKAIRDDELLTSGDLLFVRSNGNKALIGRCLFFPNVSERLAFSGFTIRGRVNPTLILPSFAAHLMRSEAVREQMIFAGGGTSINNLSQKSLANIAIEIPSLAEQERIAQVLDAYDREIALSERLLVNSRQQKEALMKDLFGGMRRLSDDPRETQLDEDDG